MVYMCTYHGTILVPIVPWHVHVDVQLYHYLKNNLKYQWYSSTMVHTMALVRTWYIVLHLDGEIWHASSILRWYHGTYVRTRVRYVRTYNVMSQLSDLKGTHVHWEPHLLRTRVRTILVPWCRHRCQVGTVVYRDIFYADNAHEFPRCTWVHLYFKLVLSHNVVRTMVRTRVPIWYHRYHGMVHEYVLQKWYHGAHTYVRTRTRVRTNLTLSQKQLQNTSTTMCTHSTLVHEPLVPTMCGTRVQYVRTYHGIQYVRSTRLLENGIDSQSGTP